MLKGDVPKCLMKSGRLRTGDKKLPRSSSHPDHIAPVENNISLQQLLMYGDQC